MKQDNWISASAKLPTKREEYIVFGKATVSTLTFDPKVKKWWSDVLNMFIDGEIITHWQPLPSPPKL